MKDAVSTDTDRKLAQCNVEVLVLLSVIDRASREALQLLSYTQESAIQCKNVHNAVAGLLSYAHTVVREPGMDHVVTTLTQIQQVIVNAEAIEGKLFTAIGELTKYLQHYG